VPGARGGAARRSAFSPLNGFMDEETYVNCVDNMRLKARRGGGAAHACERPRTCATDKR
jgi:hypothetical protein